MCLMHAVRTTMCGGWGLANVLANVADAFNVDDCSADADAVHANALLLMLLFMV